MGDDYQKFISAFKKKTGIDLSLYKEGQMKRRLSSLYAKKGYTDFTEFSHALNREPKLIVELLDRMTINVSEFYRNAKRWEMLEEKILPKVISNRNHFKVWSAACSTGEEPYTLAMILSKFIPVHKISILATDIDEKSIARAKLGVYPERSLLEVPEDMKQKFFSKDENHYKVHDTIKKMVTFKKQNLLADEFDYGFDLIVCRNVLIYFTDEAKNVLYQKFSRSLKKEGFLFVGSTEQIFNPGNYGLGTEATFIYKKL